MTSVYHTKPLGGTPHHNYEGWANGIKLAPISAYPHGTYGYMDSSTYNKIFSDTVLSTRSTFPDIHKDKNKSVDLTIKNIDRAQRLTAGLIYKFMRETGQK